MFMNRSRRMHCLYGTPDVPSRLLAVACCSLKQAQWRESEERSDEHSRSEACRAWRAVHGGRGRQDHAQAKQSEERSDEQIKRTSARSAATSIQELLDRTVVPKEKPRSEAPAGRVG
jgi:hypothetical protein